MIEVSIAKDKAFNSLSEFAQLLYLKILPHTDDYGRMEGDPATVKVIADGFSKRKTADYEAAMAEISKAGLWMWYETDRGKKVVQFNEDAFNRINAFMVKKRGQPEYPEYAASYQLISTDIEAISHIKQKAESRKQQVESKETEEKKKVAEFVALFPAEHQKLIDELGAERTQRVIEILDNYKGSKGKRYASDYRAIRSWVIGELEKRERAGTAGTKIRGRIITNDSIEADVKRLTGSAYRPPEGEGDPADSGRG